MTDPDIDRYAVIGNPIAHSRSPDIHAAFARLTGQRLVYTRVEAPLDGFDTTVRALAASGARGVNVTLPFKLQACKLATKLHDSARIAGAANALKFSGASGQNIEARNFDGSGLARDIEHNLGVALAGKRLLMLGAGGAARGVVPALLACGVAQLVVANRTMATALALAHDFAPLGPVQGCGLDALPQDGAFDVVLHATSAQLQGAGDAPAVSPHVFAGATLAYDMTYGKGLTPFLKQARDAAVPTLADGVGMLVEQAADAFEWWRGVRPPTREVIVQIAVALN
jgi:shikimate dehydrogenase